MALPYTDGLPYLIVIVAPLIFPDTVSAGLATFFCAKEKVLIKSEKKKTNDLCCNFIIE